MKLTKLTIESFRGFAKPFTFDLDANLVLLTGKNGYGKTTFFDAFEWALLGQLVRYEKSKAEKSFVPYIVNQFSKKEASVILEFSDHYKKYVLERRSNEKSEDKIILNGKELNLQSFKLSLMELLFNKKERLRFLHFDDLKYLLLRSHILEQELTSEFIRGLSPSDRFSQLSKILGTERYENFYKNLEKSGSSFKTVRKEKVEQLKSIQNTLDEKIDLFKKTKVGLRKSFISSEIKRNIITNKLNEYLTFYQKDMNLNNKQVAQIREKIISSYDTSSAEFTTLDSHVTSQQKLKQTKLSDITLLRDRLDPIKKIYKEIDKQEKELKRLIDERHHLLAKNREEKKVISRLKSKSEETEKKIKNLEALKRVSSNLNRDFNKYKLFHSEKMACEEEYSQLIKENSIAEKKIREKENEFSENIKKLKTESKKENQMFYYIEKSNQLINLRTNYQKLEPEIEKLKKETIELEREKNLSDKNLITFRKKLSNLQNQLSLDEAKLKTLSSGKTEYEALLSRVETFIKDRHCPLCGYDWESKSKLRKEIAKTREITDQQMKLKIDEILHRRKEVENFMARLQVDEARNLKLAQKLNQINDRMIDSKKTLTDMNRQAEVLGNKKEAFISLTQNQRTKEINSMQESHKHLSQANRIYKKKIQEIEEEIAYHKMKLSRNIKREKEIKTKLNNIEQFIAKYNEDLETVSLPSENITADRLKKSHEQIMSQKKKFESELNKIRFDYKRALDANLRANKIINERNEQIKDFSNIKNEKKGEIGRFNAELTKFGISDSSEIDNIISLLRTVLFELQKRKDQLNEIRESLNYQVASDQLDRMKEEVWSLKLRVRDLSREVSIIDNAQRYIKRLVQSSKTTVLNINEEFIKKHEKLINIFFNQINPHPLFRKIEFEFKRTKGKGGPTSLFIKSLDESNQHIINPSLSFSSAQLNVLALSIFLAIYCKQTWSRLETVFLDDSIQNMDDLNVLSFIDLIYKIRKDKQIIISTHDENVSKLIEKKLYPFRSQEKMYIYEYLGYDKTGPLIQKRKIESVRV